MQDVRSPKPSWTAAVAFQDSWGGAVPFLRAAGKPVDSEILKICAGLATARWCIAGAESVAVLRCLTHVIAPWFQPQQEAAEVSFRSYAVALVLAIFLSYRSCAKRRREDEEQWEDCFQEVPANEISQRSEPWRQELSREPVLVRGVSAHELLLT
eukprot:s265_g5.t1